ncbi:phosphopantothenoylcysteine decarboxylase [Phycisphaerales bacterium AB-hyl4]|uniref:Phosphopantothenoylcysteine decarboxylase n=1 Tax=Natronomicrosphaera hydrolytica TaxID=3242702 RepID=A0ABV4UB87_9BACT
MRILITAGPTREPIDAVRFISNRSSGRMGVALAESAAAAGDEVTLLLGPVDVTPTAAARMRMYQFNSSAELKQLLEAHFHDCELLIMAAAVADYRPVCVHEGKLAREGAGTMRIELQPTPDLVALMASRKRANQRVVAFALEEKAHLEERAAEKMRRKGVDAIVANPLGTMESSRITPVWLTAAGERDEPGRMDKADFAGWMLERARAL